MRMIKKKKKNLGLALSLYQNVIWKEWRVSILSEKPCNLLDPLTRCIIKIKKLDTPGILNIIL